MDSRSDQKVALQEEQLPLPVSESSSVARSSYEPSRGMLVLLGSALLLVGSLCRYTSEFAPGRSFPIAFSGLKLATSDDFFQTSARTDELCPSVANASSYSGWIGLQGDSEETPKRSFYWYELIVADSSVTRLMVDRLFEAEENPKDAPVM